MSSSDKNYLYYKQALQGLTMPFAVVDTDIFDENIRQISLRSAGKHIRIATKSIRCTHFIQRVLSFGSPFKGIMTYSARETAWLSSLGFDDILIGYPAWHEADISIIAAEVKKGKIIYLMADLHEHLIQINNVGKRMGVVLPVCLDIDMSVTYPGLRFGVWRSSVNNASSAATFAKKAKELPYVRLAGVMGYEAAIAGMGDNFPGKALQNLVVKNLKADSVKIVAKRRAEAIAAVKSEGIELDFVNGGGTGSMEWTTAEEGVTEVTAGSGFYSPGLFDNYSNFRHGEAAFYAIEIVRKPTNNIFTCFSGGYIASGGVGWDKWPKPFLPKGAVLLQQEGAGEVQTPVIYKGQEQLQLGDPIFMRHAKAGEICERFNHLNILQGGKLINSVPTYRGDGQSFG